MSGLDVLTAATLADIALGHIQQEYPHKLDHVLLNDADALPPRVLHPIFFGSFDWHSCVHGWWTLLTIRRLFPALPQARRITDLADESFTGTKLSAELKYLDRPQSGGFERPYGWAWLLALHGEAARHNDKPWAAELSPLADAFADRLSGYLDKLTYPITVGTHFNTAFALTLAHDWSVEHRPSLAARIVDWAEDRFGNERDYRGWEPGGDEFLSPALSVALLMSRVWTRSQFSPWFESFLLENDAVANRFDPVLVSDRSDGKIAHLDGLSLSRGWALRSISRKLAPHACEKKLLELADVNMEAAFDHLSGDYAGEHWLASFALLALLEAH